MKKAIFICLFALIGVAQSTWATDNITDMSNEGTAPFRYIQDATISHVKTTGQVVGKKHCAGLVGFALSGTNAISNCEVAAEIYCYSSYFGGILGHGKASKTTITDCLFSGTVINPIPSTMSTTYTDAGVIYGWGDDPGEHTIVNCMSDGNYLGRVHVDLLKINGGTQTVTNCYRNTDDYSQGTQTSATGSDLVFLLGNGWEERDDKAVPKMTELEVFENMCIGANTPMTVTTEFVDFIGTFNPVSIGKEGDNTMLYLGAANKLYWPNAEMTIGCQRAYFQLNGLTAGDPALSRIVLNFGDSDETTGIMTTNDTTSDGAWYDLQGRRLNGQPTQGGIYIHHGRKTVINDRR